MKQNDIALILVIAFVAGIASFFLSGVIFTGAGTKLTVSKVDDITSEFELPEETYFNSKSINPTPAIKIGDSNNVDPFNGNQ